MMAALLLLVAAVSCLSQGLAVVVCRCSGDVYLGAGPEMDSCCGDCGSEEGWNVPSAMGCTTCAVDCYTVIAKGWEQYPPANVQPEAPLPTVSLNDGSAVFHLRVPQPAIPGSGAWLGIHIPTPPGRPRELLHSSLQI